MMAVIDHEPHAWFLLQDGAGLVLDVNCSHSAASFSAVLRLTPEEAATVAAGGHAATDALARAIQQASGQYAARCGDADLAAATWAAIRRWRASRPAR